MCVCGEWSLYCNNSLPADKILDWSKLKECAEDKIKVTEKLKKKKNIVGKGENACYQHLHLFHYVLKKASLLGVVESWDCVKF